MQQKEIINSLKIHLSNRQIKRFDTTYKKMKRGDVCMKLNQHLKNCNRELTLQLSSLINDNYIDLDNLKQLGLYETVRVDCLPYCRPSTEFESKVVSNFRIKEKVIDNMLYAINLIDYSTNSI